MTNIAYKGPSNIRVLDAADLKRAGVEGFKKTEFLRGIATEVEPAVAQAILERPSFFGDFAEVENAPVEREVELIASEKKVQLVEGSASQEDTGTGSGSSTTAKTPKKAGNDSSTSS